MVVGLGSDLVDVRRLAAILARRAERFLERVFTPSERELCRRRADSARAFAARFAAKEACMKALGTGWGQGVGFLDVEVVGGAGSPPQLVLRGAAAERARKLGVRGIHVSLTHDGDYAAAVVVLEG